MRALSQVEVGEKEEGWEGWGMRKNEDELRKEGGRGG
jgi:hypothetical protein